MGRHHRPGTGPQQDIGAPRQMSTAPGLRMSRFVVIACNHARRRIGLLDHYGKFHLACLVDGQGAAVGSELHGPRAAIGLHYLVSAPAGQRLEVEYLVLRMPRQELLDQLHAQPVPRQRSALDRLLLGAGSG